MPQRSPTAEGFRAIFRRPSLAFAEVSWRWAFGAAASALLVFSLLEYLRTLPVSTGDLIFLRSRQPILISEAIAHIFRGSGRRLVEASLLLVPALGVLWILAASFGRAATLQPLKDYFREDETADAASPSLLRFWRSPNDSWRLRSLFGINFLRVAVTLAGTVGILGAAVVAGFASSKTDPSPGLVFLLFVPLAGLVGLVWSVLNWFLALAPLFVTHDGQDTFGSISAAAEFCRARSGPVLWSSTAFGMMHLVAFLLATSVVFFPLTFANVLPGKVTLGAILLLTLGYFVAVDFLYIARLAGYVCILEDSRSVAVVSEPAESVSAKGGVGTSAALAADDAVAAAQPSPVQPRPPSGIPASDDDILSDIPGLVPLPEASQSTASAQPKELPSGFPASDDDIVSDIPGLVPPPEKSSS
jgi:hypothetical protein